MFIENKIKYKDCQDYAARNKELIWHGKEDNLKAMGSNFLIVTFLDGRIWLACGPLTYFCQSVDEAKADAQKHYEKYDWTPLRYMP